MPKEALPGKIRIKRVENHHAHHIGRGSDGTQFMAFIVALPLGEQPEHRCVRSRWYAILHRFDPEGRHLGTETTFLGTKEFAHELNGAETRLKRMIRTLGTVKYCDVEVAPFSVRIDGHTFGLVDASTPEGGYERIDLLPNGLAFFPPWDGTYET